MKFTHGIIALGFIALTSVPAKSYATSDSKNVYLSQCDGCTAKQAKQKILAENGVGLEQKWFSIDGINQTVLAFNVNYYPEDPGSLTPTQRRGNQWFYLESFADDGRANGVTQPLLQFYSMAPVGWEKTIGPGSSSLSAKIVNPLGIAKPMADGPSLAPYPDPGLNVWNTVDAGSPMHNIIVDYVQNSNVGNIQSIGSRLSSMFSGKASIERNGGSLTVTPSFKADFYVVVQFMDGSRLSLVYTQNGWVTDPRFGQSRDSNGNSIPITADQIAPPNGIHVYDFRTKSWPTNDHDQISWAQRVGILTGGTAVISSPGKTLACTSVGGGSITCQVYLNP